MSKEDIKNLVVNKVNPLIEQLKKVKDGQLGAEEYSTPMFSKLDVRSICNKVFDETYEILSKNIEVKDSGVFPQPDKLLKG